MRHQVQRTFRLAGSRHVLRRLEAHVAESPKLVRWHLRQIDDELRKRFVPIR